MLATFLGTHYGRKKLAGLSLGLLSFKPTFLPLYLGYYLVRRSFYIVTWGVALAIGLLTLPLFVTGRPLIETLSNWLHALQLQSKPGNIDDPSPFMPFSALMLHLQPLVYRILNDESMVSTAIAWIIILLLCGYAAYLIAHATRSPKSDLLDFALVSALSLMIVYHRVYDVFLLFPSLLYFFLHALDLSHKWAQRAWALFIVIILALLSLSSDLLVQVALRYPSLLENYLWRVIMPFQAWAVVAMLIALFWLKTSALLPAHVRVAPKVG